MAVDPTEVDPTNVRAFNRYALENNNPLDVALSAIGVVSPIPGIGEGLKAARAVELASEAVRAAENTSNAVRITEKALDVDQSAKYVVGGKFDRATKQEIAEWARFTCEYCGVETIPAQKSQRGVTPPRNEAQTDHIVPALKGRTNAPSNAAHACRECNRNLSNSVKPAPIRSRAETEPD